MVKRAKDPWFKFFPSDWRADPALRSCSLAARGLWVECMCIMHEADPYGHLKVNGRPVTDAALAVLAGCLPEQLIDLIDELESAGVFSRNGDGTIYSRRMTRDNKRRITARKNGKTGGNKALIAPSVSDDKKRGNPASDNPKVNPLDNPLVKHKEARSQKPDKQAIISGSMGASAPRADAACPDYLKLGAWILETAGMSDNPRQHPLGIVQQWLADFGEEAIRDGVAAVMARPGQKPPTSLKYFIPAIAEQAGKPAADRLAYAKTFVADFTEHRWLEYLAEWSKGMPWPAPVIGPPPNHPGTLVWGHLLERYRARYGNLEPVENQREQVA